MKSTIQLLGHTSHILSTEKACFYLLDSTGQEPPVLCGPQGTNLSPSGQLPTSESLGTSATSIQMVHVLPPPSIKGRILFMVEVLPKMPPSKPFHSYLIMNYSVINFICCLFPSKHLLLFLLFFTFISMFFLQKLIKYILGIQKYWLDKC